MRWYWINQPLTKFGYQNEEMEGKNDTETSVFPSKWNSLWQVWESPYISWIATTESISDYSNAFATRMAKYLQH